MNDLRRCFSEILEKLGENPAEYVGVVERLEPLAEELAKRAPERSQQGWAAGLTRLTCDAYRLAHADAAIADAAGVSVDEVAQAAQGVRAVLGLDFDPGVLDQLLATLWTNLTENPEFNPMLKFRDLQQQVLEANAMQDWAGALALYEEMQTRFPTLPYALIGRCRTLFNLKRFVDALEAISASVGDGALTPELAEIKAEALLELGRDDEALATYHKVLTTPELSAHERAGLILGAASIYQFRGDYPAAERLLIEAMADDANNAELVERLAMVQFDQGRVDDAMISHARLLTLEPGNPWRYLDLADLQAQGGQLVDAIRTLEQGLLAASGMLETHRRLHDLYLQIGDAAAAQQAREHILASETVDPFDGPVRAEFLLADRRFADAEAVLRGLLAQTPDHDNALLLLAIQQVAVGNRDEARRLLRQLAARDAGTLLQRLERYRSLWPDASMRRQLAAEIRNQAEESSDEIGLALAVALDDGNESGLIQE